MLNQKPRRATELDRCQLRVGEKVRIEWQGLRVWGRVDRMWGEEWVGVYVNGTGTVTVKRSAVTYIYPLVVPDDVKDPEAYARGWNQADARFRRGPTGPMRNAGRASSMRRGRMTSATTAW